MLIRSVRFVRTAALRSAVSIVPSSIEPPVAANGLITVMPSPTSEIARAISATTIAGEGARTGVLIRQVTP